MNDREKVIKGLQCIIDGTVRCKSCGYAIDKHGHHSCQQNCASDAIALLKEQKAVVRCMDCVYYRDWGNGKICMRLGSYYGDTRPDWFCADGERKSAE